MARARGSLRGRRVLITSGPTREHLDPIRFLSNSSTGRMGWELARAARRLGARVVVVSGPTPLPPPSGVGVVKVVTASQMLRQTLRRSAAADVVIGAAAVSDWRFQAAARHKVKRSSSPLRLTLIPNPDIIKLAAARRSRSRRQIFVGFALETRRRLQNARKKLREKGLDLIVANGPAALGADASDAAIIGRGGAIRRFSRASKAALARAVLDHAAGLLDEPRAS